MANTYSQINIHCIFSVKGRSNYLTDKFRDELFKYMHGILEKEGVFSLAINGWRDHVHVFFELPTKLSVSYIMQTLKSSSSKWINEKRFIRDDFHWQDGYAAFSYSRSQRDNVIKYILNQEEHHRVKTFREEYLAFLEHFQIKYNPDYIFEFYED